MKFARLWNERWIRKEFSLPWKNRFICRNFELVSEPEHDGLNFPVMIFKNDFCKCFYKVDKKFYLPHAFINIHFYSAMTEASITNLNMTSIFSMCVKSFLAPKLYSSTIVGYHYKLFSDPSGLMLKISGFSEKLPLVVDIITKALRNTDEVIDKLVFETFKKELKKNCYNFIINSNLFNE